MLDPGDPRGRAVTGTATHRRRQAGPVRVLVDSSSGVTPDLARRWNVGTVPLTVTLGEEDFPDLVGMAPTAFYEALGRSSAGVKTSAPSPAAWARAYRDAFDGGCGHVVVLAVSAAMSGVVGHATTAASEFDADRVTIVDTSQAGGAQALVAIAAGRAARDGAEVAEVLSVARQAATEVHLWMALPSLQWLSRSGRLRAGPAPDRTPSSPPPDRGAVITLQDGTIRPVVPRPDTADLDAALLGMVDGLDTVAHLLVSHTDNDDRAIAMAQRLRTRWPAATVDVTPLSAVVGGHCGPGTIAVAVRTAC